MFDKSLRSHLRPRIGTRLRKTSNMFQRLDKSIHKLDIPKISMCAPQMRGDYKLKGPPRLMSSCQEESQTYTLGNGKRFQSPTKMSSP